MSHENSALRYRPGRMFGGEAERLNGGSFARHESFHFRDGWLAKGIEAVAENPLIFAQPDAMDILGVGKNMVSAIRYWTQALGLIEADDKSKPTPKSRVIGYKVSDLGRLIRRHDPFFESDDTLWILQSKLGSNLSRATVWYWAFNLFGQAEFNQGSFLTQLKRYLAQENVAGVADNSLEKDYGCYVRTYAPRKGAAKNESPEDLLDCPLAALDLISQVGGSRSYRFNVGSHPTLRPDVFVYCLYRYAEARHPESVTVPFDALQWDRESPGRLFCLDGEAILGYLERLSERRGGFLTFTRTAGLNQIHLKGAKALDLLKGIYEGRRR